MASREIDLAIINPATVLSVALRGKGIFKEPMPVRAIAVIPSWDQFVFAVRPETGLSSFEDIARRKPKLRILMRGAPDHTLHHMFDDIAAAAGFSRDDIASWGGEVRKAGSVPWPHTETFKALIRGDVDAIFDEAASAWVPQALDAGINILPLAEATVATLEAMGYRRAILPRSTYHSCRRTCSRWISAAGPFLSMPTPMTTWSHKSAPGCWRARRAFPGKSPATCRSSEWRVKHPTHRRPCRSIQPPHAFGAAADTFEPGAGWVERSKTHHIKFQNPIRVISLRSTTLRAETDVAARWVGSEPLSL